MALIQPAGRPVQLRLARDLVRSLKRGHPWVFANALRELPPAPAGTPAILLDNRKGQEVARGFYDSRSPLAFRACTVNRGEVPDDQWAGRQLSRALALRRVLFDGLPPDGQTTGFRLNNGEGDGLPGLICDLYGEWAALQLDGAGPAGFWQAEGIAGWLMSQLGLKGVYQRGDRQHEEAGGRFLAGRAPDGPVEFVEHGIRFTVDLVHGQKTGFFLDQRENRQLIRGLAAGRRVLNLFGYTGGFSVYAGLGGAEAVTTVDLARPAVAAAEAHWRQNGLPDEGHTAVTADAFNFLEQAAQQGQSWDLVIVDPPSFAPAKDKVPQALAAYRRLIGMAATVTGPDGLLATASCSSHVSLTAFLEANEEGISAARRRATLLGIYGQPADHPTPLVLPEFRYLNFVLMRVE